MDKALLPTIFILFLIGLAICNAPTRPQEAVETILTPKTALASSFDFQPCGLDSVVCKNELTAIVSAYTSSVDETDSSPCQGAGGYICDKAGKVVANNCLPLGSKVMILGTEWTVMDRMNSRYGCEYFDLYLGGREKKQEALKFGRQKLEIIVK